MKPVFDGWSHFKKKILIFDPAFQNLRNAFKGTVAVILSFFIVSVLAQHFNQPSSLAFVGVLIAMITSLVVTDLTVQAQKITFLLLPLAAVVGLTTSIYLTEQPQVRLLFFLITTFLSIILRRYGPRGTAVGTIAFFGYFAPFFFPLSLNTIPASVFTVFLVIALTFICRFAIFPLNAEDQLRLFLEGFGLTMDSVLESLSNGFKELTLTEPTNWSSVLETQRLRVRRSAVRLNELILQIETFLNSNALWINKNTSENLQLQLFDRELSLRHVLEISLQIGAEQKQSQEISKAALEIINRLYFRSQTTTHFENELLSMEHQKKIRALSDALKKLSNETHSPLSSVVFHHFQLSKALGNKKIKSAEVHTSGLQLSTRQAFQVTSATALASYFGLQISHDRWYWAAITAVVVFAGSTNSDTLMRAFLRIMGTFLGLAVGFFSAYIFSGFHFIEWSLIICCVFIGLFGSRLAFGFYTAAIFTSILALLYDILGRLTFEILILRLEETCVGAICGVLVSVILFPRSARKSFRHELVLVLESIQNILNFLPLTEVTILQKKQLLLLLRTMDRNLQTLRATAEPIVGKISLAKKGGIPGALYDASVLAHYTRHLTTLPRQLPTEQLRALFDQLGFEFQLRINDLSSSPEQANSANTKTNLFMLTVEKISDHDLKNLLLSINQVLVTMDQRQQLV